MKYISKKTLILCIAGVIVCSAAFFWLCYRADNKYTAHGPQAVSGLLALDGGTLQKHPYTFLTNGWEIYRGRLMEPRDFEHNSAPDEIVWIGQYGGFEGGGPAGDPFGSATYRMNILLPPEPNSYTLELPEIYSAYRVYVNGVLAAQCGEPDLSAYRPQTGNSSVSFLAQNRAEIIVAVTNYSYIYSGMVYPPAFGEQAAVTRLLSGRLLFRGALCVAALTIGLIALLIGLLGKRNGMAALYGLICLCFVGYVSYPITHTLFSGFHALYAVENASFCAMFVAVMLLQARICGVSNRIMLPFIVFGLLMCAASVIAPFALSGSLRLMAAYSNLLAVYKWITAGYLTFTAVRAAVKGTTHSLTLLCGSLVFDCALVIDRLLPLHEPIVTGWFPELAGFMLVLAIGVVIGREVAAEYAGSAALRERARSMERIAEMQRTWYPLLQERIEEAKTARHDLRHHFVAIGGFLENGQYDRLKAYVSEYGAAIREIEPVSYCPNDVANILAHHYARLAETHGIALTLALNISRDIKVADADLTGLLSNLLENAVEACLRQKGGRRFITLSAAQTEHTLSIRMENSGDGAARDTSGFLSAKGKGRKGYGLDSVNAIARRYGGAAKFQYDEAACVFISTVVLGRLLIQETPMAGADS